MISPTPRACPFCGTHGVDIIEAGTFRWRAAQCQACCATGPAIRIQTMGAGTPEAWDSAARDVAIDAWNGDAGARKMDQLDGIDEENDQLRALLDGAPHADNCAKWTYTVGWKNLCDCWKSRIPRAGG